MYAPIAFRFVTYAIKLNGIKYSYMQELSNHPAMLEWLTAAKDESETIDKF